MSDYKVPHRHIIILHWVKCKRKQSNAKGGHLTEQSIQLLKTKAKSLPVITLTFLQW